jgi:alpha-D-xyloside xylohydrolase
MKFENGHWQLLPDTQAVYPVSVVDVNLEADALVAQVHSQPAGSRGDLIGGSVIEVRFTSPLRDVIRVQAAHFKGRKRHYPVFDLDYTLKDADVQTGRDETRAWLKSGALTAYVPVRGAWHLDFDRGGEQLTSSEPQALALMNQNGQSYLREQLTLAPGELVYGLGERFTPFVKNGQSIDIWNADGGTDSELAYKNIPFYLTSQGYGVLVNHPGRVSFEVASHHTQRVQFSVADHGLDYYLFGGDMPKDVLDQYTSLSGRPALPPDWSFGLWLSTSFLTNYDEQSILTALDRMEQSGIPVSVFHFDCFWMKELTWCSFLWDERHFPDPAGMLKKIKEHGARICLWIYPYISELSPLFSEGMANGYFLHTPNGDVFQVDDWQPGMALVDFTNPEARAWYAGRLKALLDLGVDAFKTDFGERVPLDVCYFNGADPVRMHNYYTYLYNQTVHDLLTHERGAGDAVLFARSATCGSQKYPVHWGGDNSSSYASMAETLRGGLSLGLCGFGFWSHDISGFIGTATPDLYKRWVAFGLLSSHSRLHGSDSLRVPWIFDNEAVAVLRHFTRLKNHLMPYLLDMAQEAHAHGLPLMRAMCLEFPNDPASRTLDMQYMLGSSLLVAPIFSADGSVQYYLPAGEWCHLLTGDVRQGGAWFTDSCDYFSLPLWVRVESAGKWKCLEGFSG